MERLVPALKDHFDSLQDRLRCFYELQMQVEGWFKGELLFVLRTVHIAPFDREARLERGRVDLTVTLDGATHYVELKHWHIGRQGDAVYSPRFYLLATSMSASSGTWKSSPACPGLRRNGCSC
ncbi:MAG: hypothetical protein QN213_09975 [Armatimonadota bacterium]|nr:hypothetical protein [Armatimonadota bacterium]